MKKRNKKRNPIKMLSKLTPDIIANTGIYELPESKSEFIAFDNKQYNPRSLMRVYLNTKQLWTVALIVFKINKQGHKEVTVHHVQPAEPCKADLIADSVKVEHQKLISKTDGKEFVCAGYLAIPRDEFLSGKLITDIFDKIGVWRDYVTNNGYKLKGE